jgi:hypothetical protein
MGRCRIPVYMVRDSKFDPGPPHVRTGPLEWDPDPPVWGPGRPQWGPRVPGQIIPGPLLGPRRGSGADTCPDLIRWDPDLITYRLTLHQLGALGKREDDVAIIQWTVRWCTGLSGEPTVASANGRSRNLRATRVSLQRSDALDMEGDRTPDSYRACSVVHRTIRCTTRLKAGIAFQDCLHRLLAACWGPSASEGPQKHDLIVFLEYNV